MVYQENKISSLSWKENIRLLLCLDPCDAGNKLRRSINKLRQMQQWPLCPEKQNPKVISAMEFLLLLYFMSKSFDDINK